MAQPPATFVAQLPFLPRRAHRLTPRRPRSSPLFPVTAPPRAVFLPPEGVPSPPEDDVVKGETPPPASPRSPSSPPQSPLTNLDRLLENTEPQYTTWQQERARKALSTFSYDRPLLGADELNESLRPSHLQRHRHVLAPDEQFAAVFMWDTIVANARELERSAWITVATENNLPEPDLDDIVRAEQMVPEAAVQRAFYWRSDWSDIKRFVFRKAEVFDTLREAFDFHQREGVSEWLRSLTQYGIKCILCSPHSRQFALQVIERIGLEPYFTSNDIVTSEDEFDSLEQMFLLAAVKAQRPPSKCVVFTDRPTGVTAAHEVSAKVVALLGVYAAYEVKTADQTVAHYEDLVVYNIRRLFSEQGAEYLEPLTEVEVDRK
ncbi:5-amino-6-(5-phospho-D-ribitylamino)uracil phosphatase, chloroplastic [Gracilariopsis chorda]|uniref:5-amino-6-(5-phospho-D-ribitylamino)uracil phosphatase, chloroplastic n=1 Tax=Gracilariopsis chorda TaxID=448386 RepID=A0A2V3ILH4_9FLOR|nr:5-amino-6-(5-phospho-D-ribitylamino)uracil phosphatase, chloroplastic [Gracilariopsis chorda]|eukprot:PXF41980.1 5-amino-6-(5-phospho-D-ribitylamino)uracil phosphatase, chloroplastic [Gracilariopsis chorda]